MKKFLNALAWPFKQIWKGIRYMLDRHTISNGAAIGIKVGVFVAVWYTILQFLPLSYWVYAALGGVVVMLLLDLAESLLDYMETRKTKTVAISLN